MGPRVCDPFTLKPGLHSQCNSAWSALREEPTPVVYLHRGWVATVLRAELHLAA